MEGKREGKKKMGSGKKGKRLIKERSEEGRCREKGGQEGEVIEKREDNRGKLSREREVKRGNISKKERLRGLSYREKGEKGEAIGERVKKGRRKRELMAKRIRRRASCFGSLF